MAVSRFEGSSPVARYWLANCKGFTVRGGAHGVVEQLIHDADSLVPTRLVVRTRSRRKTIVPALAIESVVPANRVLVVERRRERRHVPAPRPTSAVRLATRTVVPTAHAAGRRVAAAGPPTKSAVAAASRGSLAAARTGWRVSQPAIVRTSREGWRLTRPVLLVLASSFRRLGAEVHATLRMLSAEAAQLPGRVRRSRHSGRARARATRPPLPRFPRARRSGAPGRS
jgi:hypothetical protein